MQGRTKLINWGTGWLRPSQGGIYYALLQWHSGIRDTFCKRFQKRRENSCTRVNLRRWYSSGRETFHSSYIIEQFVIFVEFFDRCDILPNVNKRIADAIQTNYEVFVWAWEPFVTAAFIHFKSKLLYNRITVTAWVIYGITQGLVVETSIGDRNFVLENAFESWNKNQLLLFMFTPLYSRCWKIFELCKDWLFPIII